jgi:hypothetical protein
MNTKLIIISGCQDEEWVDFVITTIALKNQNRDGNPTCLT